MIVFNKAPTNSINPTVLLASNHILTTSSFSAGYADANNDPFSGIKITSLESSGSLEFYNGTTWTAVTLNQVIMKTSLDAGYLRFIPNEAGTTATFGFAVRDSSGLFDTTPNTYTIDVNDAPVVTSAATATAINENSGAGQVVYTATATDVDGSLHCYSN